MTVTPDDVLKALKQVQDPDLHKDLVSLGFIKNLTIQEGRVAFTIELTTPACPVRDVMKEQARAAVAALAGIEQVDIQMSSSVRSSLFVPQAERLVPTIKNIIVIASGKGGVGKSTVSVNLALALSKSGARVGLLDADVYGPSIPKMLGITAQPEMDEQNRIFPIEQYGIKVMSMGFFMKPEEAVVWRGPMLHKTMEQFLGGVKWGDLDYLLADLPPGTGDVQLSLCQLIPITGAVIVSTPQDVALNVAQKAIAMFKKLNAPILGVIENMSRYVCPSCGHHEEIFGTGGARQIAQRLGYPFLGEIPLATPIRAASDEGKPIVLSDPDSPIAKAFFAVAEQLAAQASIRAMQHEATSQPKVTF
ncbi:MAG: iron-sulfur cluster carrier protein ApbC [Candidatus Omnitrophica bacterium]|nr:iron-sulfur cluster carrier protein ApbC [Candidatus Omnitrophota bacterium]MBI3010484.1 iron-sulfur cluster carrier protein ApbC [Candidatus Omnitrophota bacterium]